MNRLGMITFCFFLVINMNGCVKSVSEETDDIKNHMEIYENYYNYYNNMIEAMKNKNEEEFTENCVNLYYYIGDSSDDLTKKEYQNWSEKEIKKDLETIVHQLCDNFGDVKVLDNCLDTADKINYSSEILEEAIEYVEYTPSEEELDWGEDLFMEYILRVINE